MMRYMANFTLLPTGEMARNTVVEMGESGVVMALIPLDGCDVEPAHAIFVDGILSGSSVRHAPFPVDADAFAYIQQHTQPLEIGKKNELTLWSEVDLVHKKITSNTSIKVLFPR